MPTATKPVIVAILSMSLNAFAAIREYHADARISVLTTARYADWLARAPWFDEVLVDTRPGWWDLPGVYRLRRMLIRPGFTRQTQYSGVPLPLPMRTSIGFFDTGTSGKMRIHTRPARFMCRVRARRAASI